MKIILNKIKRRENRFYSMLYSLGVGVYRFGLPVNTITRPFFNVLYCTHVGVREFSRILLKVFYIEPLFRSQCVSVGSQFQIERLPYIIGAGHITIGQKVRFSGKINFGFSSKLCNSPQVIIGNETFIGHNTSFSVARSIVVGNNCLVAGGVEFRDNDGHPLDAKARRENLPPAGDSVAEITVGNDVWIGAGALILKGVSIGDRSVVAARSVVTKSIPADSVFAGNPARLVRQLNGQDVHGEAQCE